MCTACTGANACDACRTNDRTAAPLLEQNEIFDNNLRYKSKTTKDLSKYLTEQ